MVDTQAIANLLPTNVLDFWEYRETLYVSVYPEFLENTQAAVDHLIQSLGGRRYQTTDVPQPLGKDFCVIPFRIGEVRFWDFLD